MRKAVTVGTIIGFAIGVVVFVGYALAAWWVCSGILVCPGHWIPYAIVFTLGVTLFTLLGAGAGMLLRGMYQVTRVDSANQESIDQG